jgi:hypothetical protein
MRFPDRRSALPEIAETRTSDMRYDIARRERTVEEAWAVKQEWPSCPPL